MYWVITLPLRWVTNTHINQNTFAGGSSIREYITVSSLKLLISFSDCQAYMIKAVVTSYTFVIVYFDNQNYSRPLHLHWVQQLPLKVQPFPVSSYYSVSQYSPVRYWIIHLWNISDSINQVFILHSSLKQLNLIPILF